MLKDLENLTVHNMWQAYDETIELPKKFLFFFNFSMSLRLLVLGIR